MPSAWRSRRTCEDPSPRRGCGGDRGRRLRRLRHALRRRRAGAPGGGRAGTRGARGGLAAGGARLAAQAAAVQLDPGDHRRARRLLAGHRRTGSTGRSRRRASAASRGCARGCSRSTASSTPIPEVPATLGRLAGAGARDRDPLERRRRRCSTPRSRAPGIGDAARRGALGRGGRRVQAGARRSTTWSAPSSAPVPTRCSSSRRTAGTRPRRPGYGFDTVWVNRGGGAGRPAALGARAASCPTSPVSRSSPPRHEPLHHLRRPRRSPITTRAPGCRCSACPG